MINGFINLNKPSGISSNKALGILKHSLRELNISEKVGHMGTLDPLASGVLPVALGRATRLFNYSLDKIKVYEAEFIFGAISASLDTDTEVTYLPFSFPETELIREMLSKLTGEILQEPPQYSAKSVGGIRAYKIARSGETVSLNPKKVIIYEIKLLNVNRNENKISLEIKCGGGTYIRALGRDLAKFLNTSAVMCKLIRKQSGIFSLNDSLSLNDIEKFPDVILKNITPIEKFVCEFQRLNISDLQKKCLLNGVKLKTDYNFNNFVSLFCEGELIGIGECDGNKFLKVKTWLI